MESLKKLKLRASDSVKNKHFKQIEARLSKDAAPKPAILPHIISVAAVLLMLFLVVLAPSEEVTTNSGITKIYVNDRNIPSHSKWYVGVKESTNSDYLATIEQILNTMEPISELPNGHDTYYTFTAFTENNQKSYALVSYGNYLIDLESKQYYQFEESEDFSEQLYAILSGIKIEEKKYWGIIAIVCWLLLTAVFDKKYHPRDVDGIKLRRDSSYWQSVVRILTICMIVPLFFLPFLLNYGLIFVLITLSVLLQIWIETRNDNATWRKWMYLDQYWILLWTFFILGN